MRKQSSLHILLRLIVLVKPLIGFMVLAIILGVLGYLSAIFIPVLAGIAFTRIIAQQGISIILGLLVACGIMRGVFRYGEQAMNHTIAFRLLAHIRHLVFAKLRVLAPAKLERQDKGHLVTLITNDIELLEVFYAHTISPLFIAIIVCTIMLGIVARYSWLLMVCLLLSYSVIGGVIPVLSSRYSREYGRSFRQGLSVLSSRFLEAIRGNREIRQFHAQTQMIAEINKQTEVLNQQTGKLEKNNGYTAAMVDGAMLLAVVMILLVGMVLVNQGSLSVVHLVLVMIIAMSSFGPVLALGNLAASLQQTLASGERVLNLLDEPVPVEDISGEPDVSFAFAAADNVSFSYDNTTPVLEHVNLQFNSDEIVLILGKSGSGKSTLLKLFMRFWPVSQGEIAINQISLEHINTVNLRAMQSYMSQETVLFTDTIANNIRIGNPDASDEEVIEAAMKASLHEFIMSLEEGYQTRIFAQTRNLSGGEKQRLGLARAFLHKGELLLLDEPTSNLDSLNEAIILQSLRENKAKQCIILVSHRPSTGAIADRIIHMDEGRAS